MELLFLLRNATEMSFVFPLNCCPHPSEPGLAHGTDGFFVIYNNMLRQNCTASRREGSRLDADYENQIPG